MKLVLLARTLIIVCLLSSQTVIATAQSPKRRTHRPMPVRIVPSINQNNPQSAKSNVAQTLPLRRVILYSNGVAYFERRGMVRGHAEVELAFKQSQVDDVLKSMVVLDL